MRLNSVVILIVVLISVAGAGVFEEKKFEFGLAPGVLLAGNIYVSLYGEDVRQKSNFLIRVYADAYVISQIGFGLYFNYSTLNLEEDIEVFGKTIKRSGTPIWEIGASIKPRFILSDIFAVKPGFNIGHRQFAGDNDFSKWKGLALNASCEGQYLFSDNYILFIEIGFLYQPYGGNEDTDVTFDPLFYIVFGFAI